MDEIKNKPVVNEQPKTEPVKNNAPKGNPFHDNAGQFNGGNKNKPVSPKPIMKQMGLSENDLDESDRANIGKPNETKDIAKDWNAKVSRLSAIDNATWNAREKGNSPQQVIDNVSRELNIAPDSDEYENLKKSAMYDTRMNKDTGEYEYNRYNTGSNKLLSTPEDRSKMEELAKEFRNAGLDVDVKDGYEDYGADMKWTSLSSDGTWVLYPKDWIDYMNGNASAKEIVDRVKNGEYANVFNWKDNISNYDNIDDDYERSYGPVNSEEKYQAYLKWKENGDSFDNVSDDYDLDDKEKTPEFLKVNGEWIDVKGNQQEWGHHYFTKNGDVYYYSDEDGLEHKVGKLEGSSNENPKNEEEDDALAQMGFGPNNDGDAEEAERAYLNGGNRLDLDYDNRSIRDIANEMANDPTNPYYWYFKNKK